jgi:hypothetical protein
VHLDSSLLYSASSKSAMAIYAKLHQLGAPEQQNLPTHCVGK